MVKYRGIEITLRSQFDIFAIPEFSRDAIVPEDAENNTSPTDLKVETYVDNVLATDGAVDIFVPVYSQSQFFFFYSIDEPQPDGLIYYFKLYIDNHEVTSWGIDKTNDFKGSAMFAMYDSDASKNRQTSSAKSEDHQRSKGIMKRGFFFAPDGTIDYDPLDPATTRSVIAIKVYRASNRRRIGRDLGLERFEQSDVGKALSVGIQLRQAGYVPADRSHKFYQYALLDPLDSPFAEFRYHYRKYDDLAACGIIRPEHRLNPTRPCRAPDRPNTPPAQTEHGSGSHDRDFADMRVFLEGLPSPASSTSSSSSGSSADTIKPTSSQSGNRTSKLGRERRSVEDSSSEKSSDSSETSSQQEVTTPERLIPYTHNNKSTSRLSVPPSINLTPSSPRPAPRVPENTPTYLNDASTTRPSGSENCHWPPRSHSRLPHISTQLHSTRQTPGTDSSDSSTSVPSPGLLQPPPAGHTIIKSSPLHDPFQSPSRADPFNSTAATMRRKVGPPPGFGPFPRYASTPFDNMRNLQSNAQEESDSFGRGGKQARYYGEDVADAERDQMRAERVHRDATRKPKKLERASLDVLTGFKRDEVHSRDSMDNDTNRFAAAHRQELAREQHLKERIAAKEGLVWALGNVLSRKKE